MALFNYATRELSAKIVYYGPGLSGKTTNIDMVHRYLRPEQKGRLISLPTETDRTLFFDFLPVDLGTIRGFKVRFHLYTVPGQVFYNATRRLVLQGVDGIVFVADSQVGMERSNEESLKNLEENLGGYGKRLEDIPLVLQYNKRDLRNISTVERMNASLNAMNAQVVEGIAKDGVGVSETLVAISRLVFSHLKKTLLLPGETEEKEEPGKVTDAGIGKSFQPPEEPLEEIADVEEITEAAEEIGEPAPGSMRGPEIPGEPPSLGPAGIIPAGIPEFASTEGAIPAEDLPSEAAPVEAAPDEGLPEEAAPDEFVILPGAPPVVEETPELDEGLPSPPAEMEMEIEIEIPERETETAPSKGIESRISLEEEEARLMFLKLETPYLSGDGQAVIPAVFMDDAGNIVRMRIRIAMEGP